MRTKGTKRAEPRSSQVPCGVDVVQGTRESRRLREYWTCHLLYAQIRFMSLFNFDEEAYVRAMSGG